MKLYNTSIKPYILLKKAIRLLKTKEMIKDYVIIMIKKYDYVPSVPNIHSDWS